MGDNNRATVIHHRVRASAALGAKGAYELSEMVLAMLAPLEERVRKLEAKRKARSK